MTMKRVVLEMPHANFWKVILGPNSERVELLEALKCVKCDMTGFSFICRVRMEEGMTIKDLMRYSALTSVESLYREKDGAFVVFIEGKFQHNEKLHQQRGLGVVCDAPPELVDSDRIRVHLMGREEDIRKLLQHVDKNQFPVSIVRLTPISLKSESNLAKLTVKQRQALLTAHSLGYYDLPKRVSSEELAGHLRLDKSTLLEHLRKAEKKVMTQVVIG